MSKHVHKWGKWYEVDTPEGRHMVERKCECGEIDSLTRRYTLRILNAPRPRYRKVGKWTSVVNDGLDDATYYIRIPRRKR